MYDRGRQEVRLYVNGVLTGTQFHSGVWHAGGPLTVGRTVTSGTSTARLQGDVDEVRIFAGAMSDREANTLYHRS